MNWRGLFGGREPADGAAPALEEIALSGGAPELPTRRREREVDAGAEMVTDTVGTKVLHGWLQNRHQTLMPLNLNAAVLAPAAQAALARIGASLLLAGRPAAEAEAAAPDFRRWLAELRADADALAAFDAAMADPLPLNAVFDTALAHELTVYALVASLMVADGEHPVSTMLPDLIQARFELPTALVRSATRRYRR